MQEPSKSGVPKTEASKMEGSSHSKGKETLYPLPSLVDPLTGLSDQAKVDLFNALFSHIQSSKPIEGAYQANVIEASPLKRRPLSSTPKPPKKMAKARCGEVIVPNLDISKIEGVQETRDTRDEGLPPSSLIANPKNVPVREFESSQTMDEDDDALRTLVPVKISRPDTFGVVTSHSHAPIDPQPSSLRIHDSDPFAPFVEVVHKVPHFANYKYGGPLSPRSLVQHFSHVQQKEGIPESRSGVLEAMPSRVEWNEVLAFLQYVDLLNRTLERHLFLFTNFIRVAMRVRNSCFELLEDVLLSLSTYDVGDVSLDFLIDLMEIVEVFEGDGLVLAWII
ncbi:hypothetical protein F0562_015811 [Nyssa sinensis]|uniref:Uncharacterized protein n=1 Tax=Nyssa sinensis TaxID=561372 RepID=A0A5J4ZKZ9_9ASTE|nr:hypothetical protein F0562_015811 [Nyssa sinensis]